MARGKHAQRLESQRPLSCAEERRPDDMHQLPGISLIAISYKVLSSVICERLKPYTSTLIGPYQCGFRPGKSTIDQIFTLRQILEKTHENGIDTHHLFVDYKAAFDSPTRERLYATMSEFGIPAKLIRLCRMTLSSTISSVKENHELYELYDDVRGPAQYNVCAGSE
ncbi:uncharacterized protein LOC133849679 [Drosophila sulfurigaster albostrigata]|uniref:uncharacterized protein LOC133849679 n=1 Tax=Drosophila sulfurigaster albostrigata TaxID=89887 RepID=UPI002D21E922|nr:uncharacterized protein LOC133849679 [Drosophila sulfurigaster albostrigata]